MHVYLAATKKSYLGNSKHIEANAQVLTALRNTLSKEYLYMISHCDSAFVVWNTLTSPALQMTNIVEEEFSGDESDQPCYIVQGNLVEMSPTNWILCFRFVFVLVFNRVLKSLIYLRLNV